MDSTQSTNIVASANTNNAPTPFVVGEIIIEGNKHTKPYIIERELPFKRGDSINLPELVKGFEISRQQLMNTTLFNEVIISLKSFRGYMVDILIQVKERWYIFPIPYLKPVDRNLNEWAKQGYSVDRINYGFKFTYNNFTGRNDKLKLWLITGYTQQLQFQYDQPYANKSLKHGYKIGFTYSFNREINYATIDNQQVFVDSLQKGIRQWSGHIDYTYRPGLRTTHLVSLSYSHLSVDPRINELNPKYYGAYRSEVSFPELTYNISYVNVDYKPFPLTGWLADGTVSKRGYNREMNQWQVSGRASKGWALGKKTFYGLQGVGMLRFPFSQPYINQRMFGYGDMYLRGLEKYVIDGAAGFLVRNSFRQQILKFSVPTYIKSKSHDRIPFRIYARLFGDAGYSYNQNFTNNSLTNRALYTGGVGVDIVSFYDFVLRLDYSFNQLGQKGLFLHIKNDF
ncbi:POTRA domain-containing protein [Niastella sp. OAS944]|uniref:POTRA domain-containing protein n=1 Tax=Niastella sp. OAS944 TaxID=2664089 RepID=UPI0035C7D97E|nr:outer membrane protein assembly factor BamA [Chitinophagaceae bacterium OAS944]